MYNTRIYVGRAPIHKTKQTNKNTASHEASKLISAYKHVRYHHGIILVIFCNREIIVCGEEHLKALISDCFTPSFGLRTHESFFFFSLFSVVGLTTGFGAGSTTGFGAGSDAVFSEVLVLQRLSRSFCLPEWLSAFLFDLSLSSCHIKNLYGFVDSLTFIIVFFSPQLCDTRADIE